MKVRTTMLLAAAMCLSQAASAQSWDAQQTAVWKVIQQTWDMDAKKDSSWIGNMTHANVSGWSSTDSPAPRGRTSLASWAKLNYENSKILASELAPLSIAMSEGAAVAHYYYSNALEDREGKRSNEHGYCTDTLIKQGDSWVFLGWNCGTLPDRK